MIINLVMQAIVQKKQTNKDMILKYEGLEWLWISLMNVINKKEMIVK